MAHYNHSLLMKLSGGFFKHYQTNFFKFQQIINKEALDNVDHWIEKFADESNSNDRDSIIQTLHLVIRITYLHCIDTVFELIFGLYPRNHKVDDQNLPLIISRNNDNFNKPRLIGLADKSDNSINELHQEISFKTQSIPLLQYIFFYQITPDLLNESELYNNIKDSLKPIQNLLTIFAKDLTDKREYNSLKHALRVVPFTGFFKLIDPKANKQLGGIDFKGASNFIIESNDSIKIVTKNFDTERDFKYTLIASKMIWNIIKIRDVFISSENKPGFKNIFVYFFDNDEFEDHEKSIIHKQKIELNFKKNVP